MFVNGPLSARDLWFLILQFMMYNHFPPQISTHHIASGTSHLGKIFQERQIQLMALMSSHMKVRLLLFVQFVCRLVTVESKGSQFRHLSEMIKK